MKINTLSLFVSAMTFMGCSDSRETTTLSQEIEGPTVDHPANNPTDYELVCFQATTHRPSYAVAISRSASGDPTFAENQLNVHIAKIFDLRGTDYELYSRTGDVDSTTPDSAVITFEDGKLELNRSSTWIKAELSFDGEVSAMTCRTGSLADAVILPVAGVSN